MTFARLSGAALALLGLALIPAPASAQDYPSDTIHMIVPTNAGGGTDTIGRAIAAAMEETSDASIVVDNIAGASGTTGTIAMLQAEADGYTILLYGSSDLTSFMTFQEVPFTLDDFKYVGGVISTPTWVVANSARGYKTIDDLLDAARDKPNQVTIGVGGAAGAHAIVAHAIVGLSEAPLRVVAYQAGAQLRKGLLANEVDAGVIHSPIMLDAIKNGDITVLATAAPLDRIGYEPLRDTPLLKDSGLDINVGVTRGVYVQKDTPDEVVAKLTEMLKTAAESESFAAFGEKFGFAPAWMPPEEFEALLREERSTFQDVYENIIVKNQ